MRTGELREIAIEKLYKSAGCAEAVEKHARGIR